MRGAEVKYIQNFSIITETCCNCGVIFGMEAEYQETRKNDHKSFFCPNGHAQSYTSKTDKQKLAEAQEEVRKAQERAKAAEARQTMAENSLQVERKSHQKTKNKLKRTHHGVCPECNRQFVDLQRHMEHKHRDIVGKTIPDGSLTP